MKRNTFLVIASVFIISFLWISLDLYYTYNKTRLPDMPPQYLESLKPEIDLGALKLLKRK